MPARRRRTQSPLHLAVRAALAVLVAGGLGLLSPLAHARAPAPIGPTESGWVVQRVVDGDTLSLTRAGDRRRVRLIGIDTPETVRPGGSVQCFGPEATAFARQRLEGRPVIVEFDRSQGRVDRFGRTLAYVWSAGASPVMFNEEAVAAGMAREYTYAGRPYAWQGLFKAAAQRARQLGLGLWGACP